MRLLLVEDEVKLSEALVYILKKNNYTVDAEYDGLKGLEAAETGIYDVIILDRMLPGMEGVQILKDLRKQGITTPVLLLTARDSVSDRVEGLDAGADDYLVKPFYTDELLARVRALGRRQLDFVSESNLKAGFLEFNPLKLEIRCRDEMIRLSVKESTILELLVRNKNLVLTREVLLDRVWGVGSDVEMNNIEVNLSYLRKKLSGLDSGVTIETIRGVGYCLKEVHSHVP